MSSRRALGRLVACQAIWLAGCNAISGIYELHISDEPASDPIEASTATPDARSEGDSAKVPEASPGEDDAQAPVADVHTEPPPEEAGDVPHVFVTSTKTNGSIGGLSNADEICRDRAAAAGRTGSWVAWLSAGGSNAPSRVTSNGPWYLFNGRLAVASRSELTGGSITAAIDVDENGAAGIADGVWTGTSASGGGQSDCNDWKVNSCVGSCPSGTTGRTDVRVGGWTSEGSKDCLLSQQRLYCFQN